MIPVARIVSTTQVAWTVAGPVVLRYDVYFCKRHSSKFVCKPGSRKLIGADDGISISPDFVQLGEVRLLVCGCLPIES